MKKFLVVLLLLIGTTFCFATEEFYVADDTESWGCCYVTEENLAEWIAADEFFDLIIQYPELAEIFAYMDAYLEE